MYSEGGKLGDYPMATWILVFPRQFVKMLLYMGRHIQPHLAERLALRVYRDGIDITTYVQYHVIIPRVFFVSMQKPITGLFVYLHVAALKKSGPASMLCKPGSITSTPNPSWVTNPSNGYNLCFHT